MEAIGTTEIIGIGAVALSFAGLFWKMWIDHTKLTNKVIDVVEKNTKANDKLSNSFNNIEKVMTENTKTTEALRDKFSELLLKLIKQRK